MEKKTLLRVQDVRPVNRAALLRRLRDHGPATRTQLAAELGVSNSAVTNMATELLAEGVLADQGPRQRDGAPRLGRPATDLAIVPASRLVVGVQIGVGTVRAALCDLLGRVVARRSAAFAPGADPAPALDAAAAAVEGVVGELGGQRGRVLGVGVGAPGPVDRSQRTVLMAVNLGWSEVPLADRLERAVGLPTVVDHNVRAMALAEERFGRFRLVRDLLFVYARSGVGAGLVMGGEPFRGGVHGAVELGHLPLRGDGPLCGCGNRGCLEALAAEARVAERVRAAARQAPQGALARALEQGTSPTEALVKAVRARDPLASALCAEVAADFATALVSVVNLINPHVIVVGGFLDDASEALLSPLRRALRQRVFPALRSSVRVETTSFGRDAGIVGAATVGLDHLFYSAEAPVP